MGSAKHDTTMAEAYLRDNAGLRAALGVADDIQLNPHPLGMGEHNLNFWFDNPADGGRYVLRVNVAPQPFHDNQVAYEFAALRALVQSGCTPRPVYLDDAPTAPGEGALVIGYCEGSQLDFDNLRPGDLRCAAQLMADVHAVPVADDCPLYRPADPLRALFEECLQRFGLYRASAFEDARITRWAETFIARAQRAMQESAAPGDCGHIVNTETLPSHFLIPEAASAEAAGAFGDTGRFCAHPGWFVDWERPVIGEVAQDVAYFTSPTTTFWDSDYLFPASRAESFVEEYWRAVDGRFDRAGFDGRFRCWRMMTALRSVTWFCRALIHYNASGTHKTAKTAQKFPVYLSDEFMEFLARDCFGM